MEWPLLADLPSEDVRKLLSIARRRTFRRGEVVFHREDPADSLHLIARGRFGARVVTPLGDEVLLAVMGPGRSFGELALLDPGSRRRPGDCAGRRRPRGSLPLRSLGEAALGEALEAVVRDRLPGCRVCDVLAVRGSDTGVRVEGSESHADDVRVLRMPAPERRPA